MKKIVPIIVGLIALFSTTPALAQTPTVEPVPTVTVTQEVTGVNHNVPLFSQIVDASYAILENAGLSSGTPEATFYVFCWLIITALVSVGSALASRQIFALTFVAIFGLSLGYALDILDLWLPIVGGLILLLLTILASRRTGF